MTIYGKPGSFAEEYANGYGIPFVAINEQSASRRSQANPINRLKIPIPCQAISRQIPRITGQAAVQTILLQRIKQTMIQILMHHKQGIWVYSMFVVLIISAVSILTTHLFRKKDEEELKQN